MGTAAHITAAAPGGPRYDPSLKPEQRRDASNGIWCCAHHGRLIDVDEKQFPVDVLREWKTQAEAASARALLTLERPFQTFSDSDVQAEEQERIGKLRLSAHEDLQSVVARLRQAAQQDLLGFQRVLGVPTHAVDLDLQLDDGKEEVSFTVEGLGSAVTTFNHVTIVAPPGTGKTTTLLQATASIGKRGDLVGVYVPLSEWSTQKEPIFQSIIERVAFSRLGSDHLKFAAIHGRLILALDGWNELDRDSAKRLRGELAALERDFPSLCTLMSTRRQALDVPRSGPTVEIGPLSEQQQRSIASAIRGAGGEILLERAWRTGGVRELVTIPLYLTALLTHAKGDYLPSTREEVFRLFLEEHERSAEQREGLYAAGRGFHPQMLEALAVEAVKDSRAFLAEDQALRTIGRESARLVREHQLGAPLEPRTILEALVSYHVLIRLGGRGSAVAFQHPQFQEFYAAGTVERLMRSASSGDQTARVQLRREMLNEYEWEESILFACERASRANEAGLAAVVLTVRESLTIDPMLTAEIILRSSDELWSRVRDEVITFARRWHAGGTVDRAIRFMINTGRPEFAPFVWPLISNPDSQVHLGTLRAGKRFRLSVLGAGVEGLLRGLQDTQREHVIAEILVNGDYDGIEFVTQFVQNDHSPKIQAIAVEYLLFRQAQRQAVTVLTKSSDEVWRLLAAKGHAIREIGDPASLERLAKETLQSEESDDNPARRLHLALQRARDGEDTASLVRTIIDSPNIQFGAPNDMTSAFHEAYEIYPEVVRAALIHRLEHHLGVPFRSQQWLADGSIGIDSGPIAELLFSPDADKQPAAAAAAVVGEVTVGRLIDQFLVKDAEVAATPAPVDKAVSDESHRLQGLIKGSHPQCFARAMLTRNAVIDPRVISRLAELIAEHGIDLDQPRKAFEAPNHLALVNLVGTWAERLLADPDVQRRDLASVARATGRLASPELLPVLLRMLAEELRRWRVDWTAANAPGPNQFKHINEFRMSRTFDYRRALSSIDLGPVQWTA